MHGLGHTGWDDTSPRSGGMRGASPVALHLVALSMRFAWVVVLPGSMSVRSQMALGADGGAECPLR